MENTAIILIAVTLLLLAIIIGLLTMLIYKLMKGPASPFVNPQVETGEAPHPDVSKTEFHPAIVERMKELEKLKLKKAEYTCVNHVEEPGEASCAVCDLLYCKVCVKPFKSMHLCKEHFPVVMKNEWNEVVTIKTSSHDPEEGVRLFDMKKKLFVEKSIPSYVETHYKIDVDHDNIETYLVLFALQENMDEIKRELNIL